MMSTKPTEIVASLFELLEPLDHDERSRVIRAALLLLGEAKTPFEKPSEISFDATEQAEEETVFELPIPARRWMKQNDISESQISDVFDLQSDAAEVIAIDIPGNNGKEKCKNAYVLSGLSQLLISGEVRFSDSDAREICRKYGIYDANNHSSYMASKDNRISGSKESGWRLTGPGLRSAGELVKLISEDS